MRKKDLSSEEKIACAYFNVVRGIEIQTLAEIYNVNMGRVSEGVNAIKQSVGLGKNVSG